MVIIMSRSYKKTPVLKSNCGFSKKMANRKVRRTKDVFSGTYYKKVFDSYDICEYLFYNNWNSARKKHESEILKVINNKYLSKERKKKELKWVEENYNEKEWRRWYYSK